MEYSMTKNSFRLFLCVLMLSSAIFGSPRRGGEDASQYASTQVPSSKPGKQPRADACAVLTSADVQAVQGDAVQETKPSTQPGDGLVMSQCLFRTATPSKSVSVAIASPGSISPRTFWKKQFHSGKSSTEEEEKEKAEKKPLAGGKKQEKEEDDESTRPRAIAGVGEEAYWVGGPMVGALYVLKGNTFVRISVGGVREESARTEKSKALARLALKRL
jgi:hypothetical protein